MSPTLKQFETIVQSKSPKQLQLLLGVVSAFTYNSCVSSGIIEQKPQERTKAGRKAKKLTGTAKLKNFRLSYRGKKKAREGQWLQMASTWVTDYLREHWHLSTSVTSVDRMIKQLLDNGFMVKEPRSGVSVPIPKEMQDEAIASGHGKQDLWQTTPNSYNSVNIYKLLHLFQYTKEAYDKLLAGQKEGKRVPKLPEHKAVMVQKIYFWLTGLRFRWDTLSRAVTRCHANVTRDNEEPEESNASRKRDCNVTLPLRDRYRRDTGKIQERQSKARRAGSFGDCCARSAPKIRQNCIDFYHFCI